MYIHTHICIDIHIHIHIYVHSERDCIISYYITWYDMMLHCDMCVHIARSEWLNNNHKIITNPTFKRGSWTVRSTPTRWERKYRSCVYIYIYTYTHIHTYIHIHIYSYTRCHYQHICISLSLSLSIYIYIYIYIVWWS